MTRPSPPPGKPADLEALSALAQREHHAGRLAAAEAAYRQILAIRPDLVEVHNNLGLVLWKQGRFDLAVAQLKHALALRPDLAETHNNLGLVLWKQGQFDLAVARFEQAVALRPDFAEAHNNLGTTLAERHQPEAAVARFEQALALRPDRAETHHNLGDALKMLGQFQRAQMAFQQALTLRPDYPTAQLGLANCCLVQGDYERGWPAYEGRLHKPGVVRPRHLPRWRGEPLAGRSLLVVAEQGLGDTLQFVRYARALKERGARVVLAAQAPLVRLLASQPDLDELCVLGSADQPPRCDFYLPLLSAPGALGTRAETIPRDVPYLRADGELTRRWREELAGIAGFKIGIAWQSSRQSRLGPWRSIPLAQFAPLARLPGVRLLCLQKGFGSEQVATVDFPVLDFSDRLDEAAGPFMDTAALIGSLDLVVTTDTSVAHLAGALGAPVWVALPFVPEWRWLLDREDCPWYPTMRLFRQRAAGAWSDVFRRMAEAIQAQRSQTP